MEGGPTLFLSPSLWGRGSSDDGLTVGGAVAPSASPSSAGWLAGTLGMPLPRQSKGRPAAAGWVLLAAAAAAVIFEYLRHTVGC